MKKFLAASVVLVAGVSGYYLTQQDSASVDDEMLKYIPADTALLSAQMKPFPYKDYISATAGNYQSFDDSAFDGMDQLSEAHMRFFMSLMKQYTVKMSDPKSLLSLYGLPDSGRSYFYNLGLLPVMKIELADAAALWAELDRAEAESGFSHQMKQHEGINYRAYSIVAEDSDFIDVVVAEHQGWLTVTMNSSLNEPVLLSQALGLAPVDNPIANTTIIADIIKQYNFTNDGVSYINHEEIVKGITTQDGNLIAKHLSHIAQQMGADELSMLKSPACSSELQSIASNWPKTIMGLRKLDVTDSRVELDSQLIIESKNQVILTALQKMRGFIPSVVNDAPVMSFGLGFDVNQLAPALSEVWNDLLTPSYQCEMLAEIQGEIQQQNPMMLGMMTGMANGLKGVSFSVNGYKLSEQYGEPKVDELDALVTLSADDPMMLLNMVKPFYPPLANLQLSPNGEAVDVSSLLMLPPEFGVKAKLALKGQHLVLFNGAKAQQQADKLASEALVANGMLSASVDYAQALTPLIEAIEQSGEAMPEELKMMQGYDMRLNTSLDVTDQGIVFDFGVINQAPTK
ncbi:hypothetical protein [Shewanella maritima]|uniref:hypothetical protein n=1 Tax=Shewanella maritima TaxID=2520507 RepID=UPI003735252A